MKSIRHSISTCLNWFARFRHYGLRNTVVLYRKQKKDGIYALRVFNHDYHLRGNSVDFAVFNNIFAGGEYDFDPGFIPEYIIDAGANTGASAIFFSHRYPDAKIIAVEPEQTNYELLKRNTFKYGNIVPVHGAVYGEEVKLKISDPEVDKYAFRVEMAAENDISVKGYTIDSLISFYQIPRIDILKMDIEGAEYNVFKNEDLSWLKKVRVLVIELHEFFRPGVTALFNERISDISHIKMVRGENIIIKFRDQNEGL